MTLSVVPASIRAMVITAGSDTGMRRVTMACSAHDDLARRPGSDRARRAASRRGRRLPITLMRMLVGRGQQRAGPAGEDAARHVGRDVQGEGGVGQRIEQAVLEHEPRAVPALLAGLEHEHHRAGQPVAPLAERARGAGQHGDVGVVAAGVHGPFVLRGERQAGVLGQRQGVHVAAQQHGAAVGRAAQDGHQAAGRGALADLQRQAGQRRLHLGGGLRAGRGRARARRGWRGAARWRRPAAASPAAVQVSASRVMAFMAAPTSVRWL